MRKAQLITNEDVEDVVFDTDIGGRSQTKHERKLDEILEGLNTAGESAYIALYRQPGTGKESLIFLKKFPADKFDGMEDILEYLSTHHGSGDFRIQVRVNGRLAANNLVSVEAVRESAPQSTGDSATTALLAQIEKQNQMIAGLYQQMATNRDDDAGEEKFLQKMLMYKQLFGSSQSGGGGVGQIMETVGLLKEIGVNVGGVAEEKEEGFGDILKNALPLLQTAISQPQPQPQTQPRQNPSERPEMRDNMLKMQIKMAVDVAVKNASRGTDPATFADMCDAQLGHNAVKLVSDPSVMDTLKAYNPGVAHHERWFADVIEHVKAINGLPSRFSSEYDSDTIDAEGLNGGADNVHSGVGSERESGREGDAARDGADSERVQN